MFGKPNVLVNGQKVEHGEYINDALNKLNANEVIELAEMFSQSNQGQSAAMKKIFSEIERERN